ncbi:MAG: urease accessory protein UreH, partial [Rhodothermales bacterium]|nr:urease accessory protein UreH [Rhodothermales bacterium]
MQIIADPTLFVAALFTGFTLGVRHALDPDHIAAVSTLSVRRSEYSSLLRLAIWWGFGHTATLAVSGLLLVLLKT